MNQIIAGPKGLKRLENLSFLTLDFVFLCLAYALGIYIRFETAELSYLFTPHFYLVAAMTFGSIYVFDLYNSSRLKPAQLMAKVLGALVSSFAAISLSLYILGANFFEGFFVGRGVLALSMLAFSLFVFYSRLQLFKFFINLRGEVRCLLAGSKDEVSFMKEAIVENNIGEVKILASQDPVEILAELSKNYSVIVVGDSLIENEDLKEKLIQMRLEGTKLLLPFEFYERFMQKIPVQLINSDWTLRHGGFHILSNPLGFRVKRAFDVIMSSILLVLSIPFFLIVPIVMKALERGPIFYTQERVGFKGETFKIIKFRTMVQNAEQGGAQWAQTNDARITKLGNFLRKTRIDELPQLFCVFKGDMSLIGPRPERPEFTQKLAEVIPFYNLRHLVQPGVSGWAQVLYPYGASVEDAIRKLEYDLFYVKNYSLYLDLVIVLKTIKTVISRSGR